LTDREKENVAQDSADTGNLPPLLGANEATVAEAIEVCNVNFTPTTAAAAASTLASVFFLHGHGSL